MEYIKFYIEDIECISLINYFPKNKFSRDKKQIFFQTSFFEEKSSRMINRFKETGEFYDFFSNLVIDCIKKNIELDSDETIFIPLPCSIKINYQKRYQKICGEICKQTSLVNGYDFINIAEDCKEAKKGNRSRVDFENALKLNIPCNSLYNKNIILFDDVLTTGNTIKITINFLKKYNVKNINVITLGKTYDSIIRGKFEYYLDKIKKDSDISKKEFFNIPEKKELDTEILEKWELVSKGKKTNVLYKILKSENNGISKEFNNSLSLFKENLDCETLVIANKDVSLSIFVKSNKIVLENFYGKIKVADINKKLYEKGFLDYLNSNYMATSLGRFYGIQTKIIDELSFYPVYSPKAQAFLLENLGWIMDIEDWNKELFNSFEIFSI
ncbi:phosphoribosyltransferase family protein [Cetobacterium somerae]